MAQPVFSFLKNAKIVPMGKKPQQKADPLTVAKTKILAAIEDQKRYVTITKQGNDLPKGDKGRAPSTWFYRSGNAYHVTLRYGQLPIVLDGTNSAVEVPNIDAVTTFLDAAATAIKAGELDTLIGELQSKRSAALTGRKRK